MLRIGMCDDEIGAQQALGGLIERTLYKLGIDCRMFEFSSGEGMLSWFSKHPNELDVLFLDIEMHEINGMETAHKIRRTDNSLIIVFVTGYNDYVFDGYSVGAIDYIMKPPKPDRIEEILVRILGILHKNDPKTFTLQNTDGIFRIPHDKILYFSSDKRQVVLAGVDGTYRFYSKLDDVSKDIGERFIRIHQRYLVNIDKVDGMEKDSVIISGERLPVSRSLRGEALSAIGSALLRGDCE